VDTLLLLLADGRFPSGGHAHSGGLEAAVAAGRVTGVADLRGFLLGRLHTQGLVCAAFTAATHHAATDPAAPLPNATDPAATLAPVTDPVGGGGGVVALLDEELDARTPSPALRLTSRRQGRAQLRAARSIWPAACLALAPAHPDGPHQPVALGLTTAAAGLDAEQAALAAAYGVLTGPASAAVRLLGLDPYHVQKVLAALAGDCDAVARQAAAAAGKSPAELPCASAPLADISAQLHATWEVRLFAS
jgi:urease accessory protein